MTAIKLVLFLLGVIFSFLFIWSFTPGTAISGTVRDAMLYTGAAGTGICLIIILMTKERRKP